MAAITIQRSGPLDSRFKRTLVRRLQAGHLEQVVLAQCQVRLREGGDDEIRYETLWATKTGQGYRAGGKPLIDTGRLRQSLRARSHPKGDRLTIQILAGVDYAADHQWGAVRQPPVIIRLTRSTTRVTDRELLRIEAEERAARNAVSRAGGAAKRSTRASSREAASRRQDAARAALESIHRDLRSRKTMPGVDFLVWWHAAYTPPRPIFNMSPKNAQQLARAAARALSR